MNMTLEKRNAKLDEAKAAVLAGWCQRDLAQDAEGHRAWPTDQATVAVCAMGTLHKVSENTPERASSIWKYPPTIALITALENLTGKGAIGDYNDAPDRTKYQIAALFDHAKEVPL